MSEIKRTGGPFHRRPTDRRLVRQVKLVITSQCLYLLKNIILKLLHVSTFYYVLLIIFAIKPYIILFILGDIQA